MIGNHLCSGRTSLASRCGASRQADLTAKSLPLTGADWHTANELFTVRRLFTTRCLGWRSNIFVPTRTKLRRRKITTSCGGCKMQRLPQPGERIDFVGLLSSPTDWTTPGDRRHSRESDAEVRGKARCCDNLTAKQHNDTSKKAACRNHIKCYEPSGYLTHQGIWWYSLLYHIERGNIRFCFSFLGNMLCLMHLVLNVS